MGLSMRRILNGTWMRFSAKWYCVRDQEFWKFYPIMIKIGQVYNGCDQKSRFMKIIITRFDEFGTARFKWLEGLGVEYGWDDDSYPQWPPFLKLDETSNVELILSHYEA
jgi:hypothetical protein